MKFRKGSVHIVGLELGLRMKLNYVRVENGFRVQVRVRIRVRDRFRVRNKIKFRVRVGARAKVGFVTQYHFHHLVCRLSKATPVKYPSAVVWFQSRTSKVMGDSSFNLLSFFLLNDWKIRKIQRS